MENEVPVVIETTTLANNEEKEEVVPLPNLLMRSKNSKMDTVINWLILVPNLVPGNNKNNHGKGYYVGDRDHCTNQQ